MCITSAYGTESRIMSPVKPCETHPDLKTIIIKWHKWQNKCWSQILAFFFCWGKAHIFDQRISQNMSSQNIIITIIWVNHKRQTLRHRQRGKVVKKKEILDSREQQLWKAKHKAIVKWKIQCLWQRNQMSEIAVIYVIYLKDFMPSELR